MAGHVSIFPLSSVATAAWPSVDTVTIAVILYKTAAVHILFSIFIPSLHAVALSYVVVPVAFVLVFLILEVDSCSVEHVVLPLAIVVAWLWLVVPCLRTFTIPLVIRNNELALVTLFIIVELL